MDSSGKILIVEDDRDIAMIEKLYLENSGFKTILIDDGSRIEEILGNEKIDLILLDLMLPGKSGYEICAEIREKIDIPILMVTAKGESIDKIKGFSMGADDYITKPFEPMELVARVNSNIRQYKRIVGRKNEKEDNNEVITGDLKILTDSWKVYKDNREIKLPGKEFELLRFLAVNPNRVFSKEELFEKIWGYDYIGDSSTVAVHINRIREKIEEDTKQPKIIETIWGVGYRLNKK